MKPKNTIGFETRELSLMIGRYIEKYGPLEEIHRVRGPQAFALGYLNEHRDREIFQKDLENELSIRKPTASKLVDRMKKNGLVTTTVSTKDKRLKRLLITEKGLKHVKIVEGFMAEVEKHFRRNIPEEEIAQFFATLEKIKSNIQE